MVPSLSYPERPDDDLLDRARQGDQTAWQVLFDDCYPKIVRVLHRRLSAPMRKIYDSNDIANEVMTSLAAKFHHFNFSSVGGLRAYLINAAEQKLADGYRRAYAQKRDVTRDRSMAGGGGSPDWDPADRSPTASQLAVALEEEKLLLEDRSGEERAVLEMKIQGMSNFEVAQETGWHRRKVERFLLKLRGSWRF